MVPDFLESAADRGGLGGGPKSRFNSRDTRGVSID